MFLKIWRWARSILLNLSPNIAPSITVFYRKNPYAPGPGSYAPGGLCGSYAEVLCGSYAEVLCGSLMRVLCGAAFCLMRGVLCEGPGATKTFSENGIDCATKTCIRPCIRHAQDCGRANPRLIRTPFLETRRSP